GNLVFRFTNRTFQEIEGADEEWDSVVADAVNPVEGGRWTQWTLWTSWTSWTQWTCLTVHHVHSVHHVHYVHPSTLYRRRYSLSMWCRFRYSPNCGSPRSGSRSGSNFNRASTNGTGSILSSRSNAVFLSPIMPYKATTLSGPTRAGFSFSSFDSSCRIASLRRELAYT